MRRIVYGDGKPYFETVSWSDHRHKCVKCQAVDIKRTATFVNACAEGSPLLMEHSVRMQALEQKRKAEEVRAWAKKAGVFKDA